MKKKENVSGPKDLRLSYIDRYIQTEEFEINTAKLKTIYYSSLFYSLRPHIHLVFHLFSLKNDRISTSTVKKTFEIRWHNEQKMELQHQIPSA